MRRASACLDFAIDAPRHMISGEQFGRTPRILIALRIPPALFFRVRSLLFVEVRNVVEHEPAAFAVAQHAAFAAHALGYQDAAHTDRPDHAGGVKLNELHVLEFGSGAIRQCKAVARIFPTVAGHLEGTPDSAGGHHHRLRLPQLEPALLAVVSASSGNAASVEQQAEHRALHVDFHPRVNAVILECADHLQAGAVADVGQPRVPVPAEVSLQNPAVCGAIEKRAPCLEFAHAFRRFFGVQFGHAPVVEILAAAHRIGEMDPPVIAIVDIGQRCRDASFGHHGMRFAKQRFADHTHLRTGGSGFNGGAQACSACSNHQYVVGEPLEFRHLENSPVMPDAHRTEADIDIGKRNPKEACPGPLLMPRVQATHAVVELVPYRVIRDLVECSSDQVPERMTPEYVSAQKHDIDDQNEASNPDPESLREKERPHRVVDQKAPDNVGEPQKVAMKILHDERKASFPQISLARLAHRARRRIGPERFVIGAAVVVAGHTEQAGNPENEQRRRKGQKVRVPTRFWAKQGVRGAAEKLGRIKRRDIWSKGVMAVLERRPVGVDQKRAETQEDRRRRKPPGVAPRCLAKLAVFPDDIGS